MFNIYLTHSHFDSCDFKCDNLNVQFLEGEGQFFFRRLMSVTSKLLKFESICCLELKLEKPIHL